MDFSVLATSLQTTLGGQLPAIFGALGIIAVGWLVAVAVALAFGLGGREAAGRQMEHWLSQLRKD